MFSQTVNMPCNNGLFTLLTMAGMKEKPVHASIRRLYSVAAEVGDDAPAKVARRLNISPQTLNNWEARGISQAGSLAAQDIYGCNAVWVTTGNGDRGQPHEAASASQSQPLRLDVEIVRNVGVALNLRYEKAGGYNLAERPEEFVTAYRLWAGMPDAYDSPEVFNLVIRHADLSPQGASSDRGSEGAPTSGATGKGAGSGRRR